MVPGRVRIDGCQGTVHMSNLTTAYACDGTFDYVIDVRSSSSVTISNASFSAGLFILDSAVTIIDSTLTGKQWTPTYPRSAAAVNSNGSRSRVLVCGGSFSGGSGSIFAGAGSRAISIGGGRLELRITSQPLLVSAGAGSTGGTSALYVASSATIDPVVLLVPTAPAPPSSGPGTVVDQGDAGDCDRQRVARHDGQCDAPVARW